MLDVEYIRNLLSFGAVEEKVMTDKKTERLDVRISHEKKQAFNEACDIQSDTPSNAIRRFVNSYIRRAKRDATRAGLRNILPHRWQRIAAVTSVCLVTIIALKPFFSKTEDLFAFYDYNENGVIELGEISPNDFHLHRVLNIDGKAGISSNEFISKATMVWKFTDPDVKHKVVTKKTGMFGVTKTTKYTSLDIDGLPEGSFLFPKDANDDLISLETYKSENMTPDDLRSIGYKDLRSMGLDTAQKKEPYFNSHFVVFDLTNVKKPQINVLEKTSAALYSKSMTFSRSIDWVEGFDTPHFVMGRGSDTAVLTGVDNEGH